MADRVDDLPPRKQDAIHRALLAGLIGSVGTRIDGSEYAGVRGKKFHLFPGSALYRQRPPWVMAAEVVETTRVYAHTAAPVHPGWVERAAAHLVKRDYSDPQWRPELGRVVANERVTLQGLTLIRGRKVHYGPIDPAGSREIFIYHALVLGEYATDAPFFAHNRRLIEQVQTLEAKARRRDVLVDAKARFAFYDARIPRRVYTAREFERWLDEAAKHNPRVLLMTRRDLMLHPALGASEELYPNAIEVNGASYPLEYRFEPGDRADGITATVPLAAVNQLDGEAFQWLVPGYRPDLFAALIRTLPKALRIKFVPAPQVANDAAAKLTPADGALVEALARHLGKVSGEPVRGADFQPHRLSAYLRMNFHVVDGAGNQVAMGRDLGALRCSLELQARASVAAAPPPEFHRDHIDRWDFGPLPRQVELSFQGTTVNAYPALVDADGSVSLRLFDSPQAADEAMGAGLRRLFILQLPQEIDYVRRTLPDLGRLCDYYAAVGDCDELREDLVLAIADRAFFGDEPESDIRDREVFAARAEAGWRHLPAAVPDIISSVAPSLETFHALTNQLSREFPPMWEQSIGDMRDQLAHLIYRGFAVRTPFQWLRHLTRYLRGIDLRLGRLARAGLARDRQAMAEVIPLWEEYQRRAAQRHEHGVGGPALQQLRWMLEELRISLFAQDLKTAIPISPQRVERHLERIERDRG